MQLFGFDITRAQKAAPPVPVYENRGAWWPLIRESFTGAWQRNITIDKGTVLAYHAVYACITLIASDIAKNRVRLMARDDNGIWIEVESPSFSPVLRRPNHYQNRIRFWENWIISKLMHGNTYVLKRRDNRNIVTALYILDALRVKPLVAEDDESEVFYQLSSDNLAGVRQDVIVPAREVIHDRFNCLFHPLIGTSPIYACGLAAMQGLNIQNTSEKLFKNGARPGGILTAPGIIDPQNVERIRALWETGYNGDNIGKIAILGDGLKFERMVMTAEDSQLIEQLKWTAEVVCSTFHVPPYKIGVGEPLNNNVQSLNTEYYSQCLQVLFEDAEECLDEGLGIGWHLKLGTEFDIDNLLRMDSLTQIQVLKEGAGAGIFHPNYGRAKFGLTPAAGGDTPYLQEQNFSLAALNKRDQKDDPFAKGASAPTSNQGAANDGNGNQQQPNARVDELYRRSRIQRAKRVRRVA